MIYLSSQQPNKWMPIESSGECQLINDVMAKWRHHIDLS
jgi:hypothetical protein